jgi:hypothetical protein
MQAMQGETAATLHAETSSVIDLDNTVGRAQAEAGSRLTITPLRRLPLARGNTELLSPPRPPTGSSQGLTDPHPPMRCSPRFGS